MNSRIINDKSNIVSNVGIDLGNDVVLNPTEYKTQPILFNVSSKDRNHTKYPNSHSFKVTVPQALQQSKTRAVELINTEITNGTYNISEFNNKIYFSEFVGGATDTFHTATIAPGEYTLTTLLAEIPIALRHAPGRLILNENTYTAESETITGKISVLTATVHRLFQFHFDNRSIDIVSSTAGANTVLTTAVPHNLVRGSQITVVGNSDIAVNGVHTVQAAEILSATTVQLTGVTGTAGGGTGGKINQFRPNSAEGILGWHRQSTASSSLVNINAGVGDGAGGTIFYTTDHHWLLAGNQFTVTGNTNAGLNILHTVQSVISPFAVRSTIAGSLSGTGGTAEVTTYERVIAPGRFNLSYPNCVFLKIHPVLDDAIQTTSSVNNQGDQINNYFAKLQLSRGGNSNISFTQGHQGKFKWVGNPDRISELTISFHDENNNNISLNNIEFSFTLAFYCSDDRRYM